MCAIYIYVCIIVLYRHLRSCVRPAEERETVSLSRALLSFSLARSLACPVCVRARPHTRSYTVGGDDDDDDDVRRERQRV